MQATPVQLLARLHAPGDDRAIALAGAGRIDLSALISDLVPLGVARPAFAALAATRGLKVIVHRAVAE